MSNLNHIAKIFNELSQNRNIVYQDNIYLTYNLFIQILNLFAPPDTLHFASIFTKIAWISTKYKFSSELTYYLHTFRRSVEQKNINQKNEAELNLLALYACEALLAIADNKLTPPIPTLSYFKRTKRTEITSYRKSIEGLIISYNKKDKQFVFCEESNEDVEKTIQYDITGINELFTPNILLAESILTLPTRINLIDVDINTSNEYLFKAIIFVPDLLIDVSTIAASNKSSPWLLPLDKLSPRSSSEHILLGNLVNFILNELLFNNKTTFDQILTDFFINDPIKWILYSDDITNEIVMKAKTAYHNILRIINQDFLENNILPEFAYIEPSFLSPKYGIQGRLDLLNVNSKEKINNIVELKSGKVFRPNQHGIADSHFSQCLLYDLLINSTTLGNYKTLNYILYSSLENDNLKFAPNVKTLQYDLMNIRNQHVLMEFGLAVSPEKSRKMLDYLNNENFPGLKGFFEKNLIYFQQTFNSLTELERSYYSHFVSFINREFLIRKIGYVGEELVASAASLWTEDYKNKAERFSIISNLILITNNADKKIPTLVFEYSSDSHSLSNFREGDIVTLVPFHDNPMDNVAFQIFKGTLLEYNAERVVIQLRHTQHNNEIFRKFDLWNIEPDFLDSAFRHYYNNLSIWANCPDLSKRLLVLGTKKPEYSIIEEQIPLSDELTPNQKNIVLRSFYSKDYMLIWGPPGTGKTSMILKHLSKLIFNYSEENILILAYTNKAVDEICVALKDANLTENVIRIGNRNAIHPEFENLLLNSQIKHLKRRSEIAALLKRKRITVSTIAAFLGKLEILEIKQFDTLIIDEASQIIEPMICGILTLFKRFILIGDHMQLPAIVQQHEKISIINDPILIKSGFNDMRISLFERLYTQVQKHNDWEHAIGILTEQGRMHQDIMNFVNVHYYKNKLTTISPSQTKVLNFKIDESDEIKVFANNRLIFINVPNQSKIHQKRNLAEAEIAAKVVKIIKQLYKLNDQSLNENSIGIITPFRAQINQIKQLIEIPKITIDTVERFQGGAKDIIIISTVVNSELQLSAICSYHNQVDRKLNVALTRARKQIILIGNKKILEFSENYNAFIKACAEIEIE